MMYFIAEVHLLCNKLIDFYNGLHDKVGEHLGNNLRNFFLGNEGT